jgi:transposase InsO family protein
MVTEEGSHDLSYALEGSFFFHGCIVIERSFYCQEENGEIFYALKEAQVLIEEWRLEYNTFRPHSSLKYRPPAPEAWLH